MRHLALWPWPSRPDVRRQLARASRLVREDAGMDESSSETELRERLAFERATTQMLRGLVDCDADAIDEWITGTLAILGSLARADRAYVTGVASHEWRRDPEVVGAAHGVLVAR